MAFRAEGRAKRCPRWRPRTLFKYTMGVLPMSSVTLPAIFCGGLGGTSSWAAGRTSAAGAAWQTAIERLALLIALQCACCKARVP